LPAVSHSAALHCAVAPVQSATSNCKNDAAMRVRLHSPWLKQYPIMYPHTARSYSTRPQAALALHIVLTLLSALLPKESSDGKVRGVPTIPCHGCLDLGSKQTKTNRTHNQTNQQERRRKAQTAAQSVHARARAQHARSRVWVRGLPRTGAAAVHQVRSAPAMAGYSFCYVRHVARHTLHAAYCTSHATPYWQKWDYLRSAPALGGRAARGCGAAAAGLAVLPRAGWYPMRELRASCCDTVHGVVLLQWSTIRCNCSVQDGCLQGVLQGYSRGWDACRCTSRQRWACCTFVCCGLLCVMCCVRRRLHVACCIS
jgi:hypothetical protein